MKHIGDVIVDFPPPPGPKAPVNNKRGEEIFCPIPGRAMRDDRLTQAHWRLLAAICRFDGLGRNGQNCWASATRLAEETGLHEVTVRARLPQLEQFGYIERAYDKNDGRRKIIRKVVYNSSDHPKKM